MASNTRFGLSVMLAYAAVGCGHCWVFTDIKYDPKWRSVGDSKYLSWDERADQLRGNEITSGEETEQSPMEYQERFNLIFPGTRWCGAGNIASDYDDLGPSREADKCCREHDNCEDIIPAGDTRHNLTNEAFYTRLSCECDERFRRCLRAADTRTARNVGVLYFDAIGTQCYREDLPATACRRRGGFLDSKCLEYEYDASGERRYQWFDVPLF